MPHIFASLCTIFGPNWTSTQPGHNLGPLNPFLKNEVRDRRSAARSFDPAGSWAPQMIIHPPKTSLEKTILRIFDIFLRFSVTSARRQCGVKWAGAVPRGHVTSRARSARNARRASGADNADNHARAKRARHARVAQTRKTATGAQARLASTPVEALVRPSLGQVFVRFRCTDGRAESVVGLCVALLLCVFHVGSNPGGDSFHKTGAPRHAV